MVTRGSSVTVAPFPPGDGSFHSEYIEGGQVKERCVLDRLQYIFEALSPDTRPRSQGTTPYHRSSPPKNRAPSV